MSQNEDLNWTHFNVRCETTLRERAEEDAKLRGQSLSEWIRRAMMEKLQNSEQQAKTAIATMPEAELKETLRRLMEEINAETKKGSKRK